MQNQIPVLAKRAAEVAETRENGGGHMAGIIQERCFVETVNLHFEPFPDMMSTVQM